MFLRGAAAFARVVALASLTIIILEITMTDTVPAAATGLPAPASTTFDRRGFMATLAAAGVMTGGTVALAAPDGAEHPDAALLELVATYEASEARNLDYVTRHDAVFDTYRRPLPPEALFWRSADFLTICSDRSRLPQVKIEGELRSFYGNDHDIRSVRDSSAAWKSFPPESRFCSTERNIARAEEIIAAHDEWCRAQAEAKAANGLADLEAAILREGEVAAALLLRIAAQPAATPEGIAAKARSAALYWTYDIATLSTMLQRKIADEDPRIEEILGLSLILDAVKLSGPATLPASSSERSAA